MKNIIRKNAIIANGCLIAIILLVTLLIGCVNKGTIPPEKTSNSSSGLIQRDYSDLLLNTITEMEGQVGKPIEFKDINNHPNIALRTVKGACEITRTSVIIWLDADDPLNIQEIYAGHELGHLYQIIDNWSGTASPNNANNQPLIPEISFFGSEISSLIQDPEADNWASNQGFNIREELELRGLPTALTQDLTQFKPNGHEAEDWKSFYNALYAIAKNLDIYIKDTKQIRIENQELKTLRAAVFFAKLKLRFEPYGLFSKIDKRWENELPISRKYGLDIASIVENIGFSTKKQNDEALIAVLEYLNLPTNMICVFEPSSEQILWPK